MKLVFLLVLTPFPSWSQLSTSVPVAEIKVDCPQLPYLPESDSVGRRRTVDSVTNHLVGRWELIQTNTGWSYPRRPHQFIEMSLNRQGQGAVYGDGVLLARFELTLSRRWGSIWFKINESGKPFFNFRLSPRHYGLVKVCNQALILSDARGDGMSFVFKQITGRRLTNWDYNRSASALLNDSTWYGAARAFKEDTNRLACPFRRFTLGIITDILWQSLRLQNDSTPPVTGCLDTCTATQLLELQHIPLAVGYYRLIVLDTCGRYSSDKSEYDQLDGDVIVNAFHLVRNDNSWIEITKYDAKTNVIEGAFDLTFINKANKLVHFSNSFFRTTVAERE